MRPRTLLVLGLLSACPTVLFAQSNAQANAKGYPPGYTINVDATATGEELTRQDSLWVMEVYFKPMRLVTAQITDPETGEKEPTLVWYTVYRAVNRPLEKRSATARDVEPVNEVDQPPGPPLFAPEFTLVTTDNDRVQVYEDEILPEAQAAIAEREGQRYPNAVEVVGPVPDPQPLDSTNPTAIEGVVTFRGIDPRTDFFTLLGEGFSNGYQITEGPDGEPLVWRKTIALNYWRPGDEFFEKEKEFRLKDRPTWFYRPDEAQENPLAGLPEERKPEPEAEPRP